MKLWRLIFLAPTRVKELFPRGGYCGRALLRATRRPVHRSPSRSQRSPSLFAPIFTASVRRSHPFGSGRIGEADANHEVRIFKRPPEGKFVDLTPPLPPIVNEVVARLEHFGTVELQVRWDGVDNRQGGRQHNRRRQDWDIFAHTRTLHSHARGKGSDY